MQISVYSMSVTERCWRLSLSGASNRTMCFLSLGCSTLQWDVRTYPLFSGFQFHVSQPFSQLVTSLFISEESRSIQWELAHLPTTTPTWCLHVLSLCSLRVDSFPSQPDLSNRCLHVLSPFPCYLVPDSLQSSFGPHCDTRTAFAEGRKDHLVGILWSSSYSYG